jgi:hypothetical protein
MGETLRELQRRKGGMGAPETVMMFLSISVLIHFGNHQHEAVSRSKAFYVRLLVHTPGWEGWKLYGSSIYHITEAACKLYVSSWAGT